MPQVDGSDPGGPPSAGVSGPAPPAAAIVLAAGEGRRMHSAVPKVLHPIGGASLLAHSVTAVAASAPGHLVVVVGHGHERVSAEVAALGERLGRVVGTARQDEQLGTAHAARCGFDALPAGLTGPVLVVAGDVPLLEPGTLAPLLAEHAAGGAAVTLLEAGGAGQGAGDVGACVLDAALLADLPDGGAELGDVVAAARRAGREVREVPCPDTWQIRGVDDQTELAEARAELNRRVLRRWMLAGVTVVDPATTWVDVDVRLGREVVLHPGTQLHGATVVDDGARIGPDTTLTDCVIGAGATVVRTHGSSSEIGPDAAVGPFAYLRPGARLGPRGKIGTFVEVKNADIGAGSKVPHLTYVGDATIGEESNIGAASVFVNYDGVRKHRTVVGSHVRTGSDTMFIAPLRVGDGAYTGAGTILREDVPPGALAVSAGSQRIIEGWVERNRPGTPAAEAAGRYRSGPPSDDAPDDGRGGPAR